MYFSLRLKRFYVLSFASAKERYQRKAASRTPLAKGVLENLPTGWGILAFEAKMLPTNEKVLNDPPIKRKAFFGAGLLFL